MLRLNPLAVCAFFASWLPAIVCGISDNLDQLQPSFQDPPIEYGPHVFWHWVNGNINRGALEKDISTLFEAKYGGVLISDVQAGIPAGAIEYNSDTWLDLLVHAVDTLGKNGMKAAMHNAPGYSGIGSAKLPVNMTMKELVWTETRVAGNESARVVLLKPFSKMGVYEDLFAFAYPAQAGEGPLVFRDAVTEVRISGTEVQTNITETINREQPLRLDSSSAYLDLVMGEPFTAQAIAIYRIPEIPLNTFDGARDYPPSWSVSVSNNSVDWSTVKVSVSAPALREMDAPAVITFTPVVARYIRLQPNGPSWVTGIDVSSSPRLPNWAVKAHGAPGTVTNPGSVIAASSAIDPLSIIDVSDKLDLDGNLDWMPQNGTYTIVRIGYTVTGQEMPATPDRFGGLSVDLFSTEAIDTHFDTHLTRIINALRPYIPQTFFGFEVDSYELGMQNWGGNLEQDFETLRGYSMRPWILAATGRILGSAEQTERFLYDFRLTHANLVRSNCYGYFQERLRQENLSLLIEPYGDGPFDSLELATAADYAYGEFWAHYIYGSDGYAQIGASSDQQKGINLQFSEAFTGQPDVTGWTEHPYQLKTEGDRMMTLGVNRFYLHSYAHQPVDAAFPGMTFGPFGTHFDRMNTWNKQQAGWNKYISRASYILQNTASVVDVACFTSEEPSSIAITYDSPYFVPLTYQADIFSRFNLLSMEANNGRATYQSGTSYGLLVFPNMPSATAAGLAKIIELASGGVPILLLSGSPTQRAVGLNNSDSDVVALAQQLWGMAGKGTVFTNTTVQAVLQQIGLSPHLEFTSPTNQAAIYYRHKTAQEDDVYFVSNGLREPVDVVLSLQGSGTPEIWDPMTGSVSKVTVSQVSNGRTLLSYHFGPSESIILALRGGASTGTRLAAVSKDGQKLLSISPYEAFNSVPYANLSSSFTVTLWAKPEVAQYGTSNYVFYPSASYGSGHAATSLSMGWDGIQIGEATSSTPSTILSLTSAANNFSISGWTHIAVVYVDNTPSLYMNGELLATGPHSSSIVHPGVGMPDATAKMTKRFDGDISGLTVHSTSLSLSDIQELYSEGLPPPESPPQVTLGDGNVLIRQNGQYDFTGESLNKTVQVQSALTVELNSSWTVSFPANRLPANRDGPLVVELSALQSLKNHPDFDIAHFSGTAVYNTTFRLPVRNGGLGLPEAATQKVLLTLGRVENIANVTVNGKTIGLSWLPPYELDITTAVKVCGNNILQVEVTNCWPNRLIGDETLPIEDTYNSTLQDFAVEEWPQWFIQGLDGDGYQGGDEWGNGSQRKPGDRVTFGAWKHFSASDPLFESGLLGPVTITLAVELALSQ